MELSPLSVLTPPPSSMSPPQDVPRGLVPTAREEPRIALPSAATRPREASRGSTSSTEPILSTTALRPRDMPLAIIPTATVRPAAASIPIETPRPSSAQVSVASSSATPLAQVLAASSSATPLAQALAASSSATPLAQVFAGSSSAMSLNVSTSSVTPPLTPPVSTLSNTTSPSTSHTLTSARSSVSDSSTLTEELLATRLGNGMASRIPSSNRTSLPPPPGFHNSNLERSLQQLLAADARPGLSGLTNSQLSTANQLTDVLRRLDSAVDLANGAIRSVSAADAASIPSISAILPPTASLAPLAPLAPSAPSVPSAPSAPSSLPSNNGNIEPTAPQAGEEVAEEDDDLIIEHEEPRGSVVAAASTSRSIDRSEDDDDDDDDDDDEDDFIQPTPSNNRPLVPPVAGKKRTIADVISENEGGEIDDSHELLFLKLAKWTDSLNISTQGADSLQTLVLSPSLFNDTLSRVCTFGFTERSEKPFLVIKNSVLGSTKKLSPIFWVWYQSSPSGLKAEIVELLGTHPSSNIDDLTRKTLKFISLSNCSDTAFVHVCLKVCKLWRDRVEVSVLAKRSIKWKPHTLHKEFDLVNLSKMAKK